MLSEAAKAHRDAEIKKQVDGLGYILAHSEAEVFIKAYDLGYEFARKESREEIIDLKCRLQTAQTLLRERPQPEVTEGEG